MREELTKALLFFLTCIVLSCLVPIMVLFVSGGQRGSDLQMLMHVQILGVVVGAFVIAWSIVTTDAETIKVKLTALYQAMPQWLIFSTVILNLLVASGEIALITVSSVSDGKSLWSDHVALVSMMVSSVAFCLLYAHNRRASGQQRGLSGRWHP